VAERDEVLSIIRAHYGGSVMSALRAFYANCRCDSGIRV